GGLRPPSEASPQRIDCAGEAGARTPPFCDRAAATSPRPTLESRPRWYSAPMPSIADSVVEMVQWVFPEHAGAPGQIHGGRMMQWITEAGTLAAARVARGHVVLGATDDIDFLHPVRVGQIAILRAQVEYVGTSSLEVGVRVWAEDVATGARAVTLNSHLVFVKVGDDMRPRRVPVKIEAADAAEASLGEAARRRRAQRPAGGRARREHAVRRQDANGARRGRRDPVDAVLQGPRHDGVPGRAGLLLADLHARGRHLPGGAQPRGHLLARDWRQGPD